MVADERGRGPDPLRDESFHLRAQGVVHPKHVEPNVPAEGGPGPLVRPYAITGGRTHPRHELAVEALVSTLFVERDLSSLTPEVQAICELCREVRSVAEVSALLRMPLGVARVLIADLANDGVVHVRETPVQEDGQPDLMLLERVLSGLHRL